MAPNKLAPCTADHPPVTVAAVAGQLKFFVYLKVMVCGVQAVRLPSHFKTVLLFLTLLN